LSTTTIIRLLSGTLLLSYPSVSFRDGNYGRTSERAYQIHHLRERTRFTLAISPWKTTGNSEKKGKAIGTFTGKTTIERPRRPPLKIIITRPPRGARCTIVHRFQNQSLPLIFHASSPIRSYIISGDT
jgi:hypothetical protein